jgi:hypothetical protein
VVQWDDYTQLLKPRHQHGKGCAIPWLTLISGKNMIFKCHVIYFYLILQFL